MPNRIRKGMMVWIPCDVRSGPFPNERRIYIKLEQNEWFGFVDESQLRERVREGSDHVQARVVAIHNEKVVLGIRGQSPASRPIETSPSVIRGFGPVAA